MELIACLFAGALIAWGSIVIYIVDESTHKFVSVKVTLKDQAEKLAFLEKELEKARRQLAELDLTLGSPTQDEVLNR